MPQALPGPTNVSHKEIKNKMYVNVLDRLQTSSRLSLRGPRAVYRNPRGSRGDRPRPRLPLCLRGRRAVYRGPRGDRGDSAVRPKPQSIRGISRRPPRLYRGLPKPRWNREEHQQASAVRPRSFWTARPTARSVTATSRGSKTWSFPCFYLLQPTHTIILALDCLPLM